MSEYHKINSLFKRDPDTKFRTFLKGEWAQPEFAFLQHNMWEFTEKVDGTNIRIILTVVHDEVSLEYRGRTDAAHIPSFLLDALHEQFDPLAFRLAEQFPEGVVLYGEGYGPKIQRGGENYRADHGFVLFDVRVGNWWLQREDVEGVCGTFGIQVVPIIGGGTLHDMMWQVKGGITSTWGDFPAEGIVARPVVELRTRAGHRVITKLKTKDFM